MVALAVTAQGLVAWQAHLARELGRELEAVDHDVSWSIYFTDPDGNPFEITTYDYEAFKTARRSP